LDIRKRRNKSEKMKNREKEERKINIRKEGVSEDAREGR
jgi:hypothetical protein